MLLSLPPSLRLRLVTSRAVPRAVALLPRARPSGWTRTQGLSRGDQTRTPPFFGTTPVSVRRLLVSYSR